MKKIIYMASMLLAMSFTSCEDFLTVSSPDKLTTNRFWRNEKDVQAGMASAYAQLYHGDAWATSEVRWPTEAYRTDLYELGQDAINYDTWTDLYKFTYTNGNTQFSYYYQDLYRGINFVNQVIYHLPHVPAEGISDERRALLTSEAHFLRGYYHMMLLLNWKDIIIRDEYIQNDDQINKGLSNRVACWDFVVAELLKATEALPAERSTDELGRATSGAAYSYLGFAYLTRAYEESAKKDDFLAKAIDALNHVKGYELVGGEELINMFNGRNKNCKESIFEVQYTKNTANGARYNSCIHFWIAAAELGGWDEIIPNQILMNEYLKEGEIATTGRYDSRLYNTIYFDCDYFNDGTGRVIGMEYKDRFNNEDADGNPVYYNRPVFRKFTAATLEEMDEGRCAFNIPLMRYANVLLMKAEVLNLQGNQAAAIELINQVRSKHGDMPAMTGSSFDEVQAQIEHERIIEFPLESYRWYDMRRWGKLKEVLHSQGRTNFTVGRDEFYPIPLWEITSNTSLQK